MRTTRFGVALIFPTRPWDWVTSSNRSRSDPVGGVEALIAMEFPDRPVPGRELQYLDAPAPAITWSFLWRDYHRHGHGPMAIDLAKLDVQCAHRVETLEFCLRSSERWSAPSPSDSYTGRILIPDAPAFLQNHAGGRHCRLLPVAVQRDPCRRNQHYRAASPHAALEARDGGLGGFSGRRSVQPSSDWHLRIANLDSVKCKSNHPTTEVRMEPTIGLEPMTCRLRIDCSTN